MTINITKETADKWRALLPVDYRVGLNPALIKRQKLSKKDIGNIFKAHGQKCFVFDKARTLLQNFAVDKEINAKGLKKIESILEEIKKLEFKAQQGWKFEENPDYHNWWLDIPGCECPRMDNLERSGVSGNIHVENCPWHGWFREKAEI